MHGGIEIIDGPHRPDTLADRWLRVFLAVVDAGSLTAAARRLGTGQPAVSHAIKQLEASLGTPVFHRQPGGVRLSPAGRQLANDARAAYDLVDESVRRFRAGSQQARVELSVSTPLATYWLMPRLSEFRLLHPSVELRISTSDTDRLVGHDDADLWIPLGWGTWPGLERWPFQQERIYPVAAPDHPLAGPSTQPEQLVGAELLSHEERYRQRFEWASWFGRLGVAHPAEPTGPSFNDYSLVVRAALAGQGVALGWHHIVVQLVHEGRLVRVGCEEVVTDQPFEILARPHAVRRPAVAALRDWLTAAARRVDGGPGIPRTPPPPHLAGVDVSGFF
jgi:DNA-binding transcriptional LysR family regulator